MKIADKKKAETSSFQSEPLIFGFWILLLIGGMTFAMLSNTSGSLSEVNPNTSSSLTMPTLTPIPEPSERALQAANYVLANIEGAEKAILQKYGTGSDNVSDAIRNWAIFLDENLQELIKVEAIIDKDKVERSRPIYNQQPAPVFQQDTSPKHCTSNTIGDYTYTNCY